MILFPEEQTLYSRDNTLDPAYFAKKLTSIIGADNISREVIE